MPFAEMCMDLDIVLETAVSQRKMCRHLLAESIKNGMRACPSCPTLCYPHELSKEFSRQVYWSELQFPAPGDLPDARIKPMSLALAGGFFTAEPGKPRKIVQMNCLQSRSSLRGRGQAWSPRRGGDRV